MLIKKIKTTSYHFTHNRMARIKMKLDTLSLVKKLVTKDHELYNLILMKVQNI